MKSKRYFWIIGILAAVVAWHLLNHSRKQTTSQPEFITNTVAETNPSIQVPATNSATPEATAFVHTGDSNRDDVIARYHKGLITKGQAMQEMVLGENKHSQDFYGKVIDQSGNALANASVSGELVLNDGTYGGVQVQKFSTASDENGLFEFTGIHGAGLSVRVSKEGYEIEGKNQTYKGPVEGKTSPTDRAVFTLWSANIHEKLVIGNKSFEILPDGRPYFIDLTEGTISEQETGDLKVWIQYTNQVVQGRLYDWSAEIDVINGGLLEVQQVAINSGFQDEPAVPMYIAPQDGYTPSFHMQERIKGGQSGEIGNRYFYLLLNNGKEYGRMSINLFAPYGRLHPGFIRLSYAINPSGSQILR